jgi:S1-C subfamily serine protease
LNGKPVSARFYEELPGFYNRIASMSPGSELTLKILRDEQEYTFAVTTKLLGDLQGEDFEVADWGFTVKGITRQMRIDNQLRDSLGVFVVGVKRVGPGDAGGLNRSDVIVSVNKENVTGLPDFISKYNQLAGQEDKVLLTIQRAGATRLVVLSVDSTEEVSLR